MGVHNIVFRTIIVCGVVFLVWIVLGNDGKVTDTPRAVSETVEQFSEDTQVNVEKTGEIVERVCPGRAVQTGLQKAVTPELRKLYEYQHVCHSLPFRTVMIFVDMPETFESAKEHAHEVAQTLREFASFGIIPLVIVEPTDEGTLLSLALLTDATYRDILAIYFQTLREEGIHDEDMGIWVPFPEANTPYLSYGSMNPKDFSTAVNIYLSSLKHAFPGAQKSILLNAASYEEGVSNWNDGKFVSLLPYVSGIEKGLVDSVGIQGFPWVPPKNSLDTPLLKAQEFLKVPLILEATKTLGISKIWLNTGTFSEVYTQTKTATVALNAEERESILLSVLEEAQRARDEGYSVSINVFAEDKSATIEGTNWSYFNDPHEESNPHRLVLMRFLRAADRAGIAVSLFDTSVQYGW